MAEIASKPKFEYRSNARAGGYSGWLIESVFDRAVFRVTDYSWGDSGRKFNNGYGYLVEYIGDEDRVLAGRCNTRAETLLIARNYLDWIDYYRRMTAQYGLFPYAENY